MGTGTGTAGGGNKNKNNNIFLLSTRGGAGGGGGGPPPPTETTRRIAAILDGKNKKKKSRNNMKKKTTTNNSAVPAGIIIKPSPFSFASSSTTFTTTKSTTIRPPPNNIVSTTNAQAIMNNNIDSSIASSFGPNKGLALLKNNKVFAAAAAKKRQKKERSSNANTSGSTTTNNDHDGCRRSNDCSKNNKTFLSSLKKRKRNHEDLMSKSCSSNCDEDPFKRGSKQGGDQKNEYFIDEEVSKNKKKRDNKENSSSSTTTNNNNIVNDNESHSKRKKTTTTTGAAAAASQTNNVNKKLTTRSIRNPYTSKRINVNNNRIKQHGTTKDSIPESTSEKDDTPAAAAATNTNNINRDDDDRDDKTVASENDKMAENQEQTHSAPTSATPATTTTTTTTPVEDKQVPIKLGLNLLSARQSATNRRKRIRSLTLPGETTTTTTAAAIQSIPINDNTKKKDKEKDDDHHLANVGAMLSSSNSSASNNTRVKFTMSAGAATTTTTTTTSSSLLSSLGDTSGASASFSNTMIIPPTTSKRLLPPMKPLIVLPKEEKDEEEDNSNNRSGTISSSNQSVFLKNKKNRQTTNDNFVRLNLRNSAGSCRGARNKKNKKHKFNGRYNNNQRYNNNNQKEEEGGDENGRDNSPQDNNHHRPKERIQMVDNFRAGVDPLDDYLDGVLNQPTTTTTNKIAAKGNNKNKTVGAEEIPKCTRHQRPCKLLTVKKTGTGNKGRKFYCCSMPRGEQCDHFQWADDTIQAAKMALLKNSSHSGFMARQVAAYSERFKKLTVPELRDAAKRRGLNTKGKKQQLLLRLSLWVRDELATVAPSEDDDDDNEGPQQQQDIKTGEESDDTLDVSGLSQAEVEANSSNSDLLEDGDPNVAGGATSREADDEADNDEDSCCSSSDEELELFQNDVPYAFAKETPLHVEEHPTNNLSKHPMNQQDGNINQRELEQDSSPLPTRRRITRTTTSAAKRGKESVADSDEESEIDEDEDGDESNDLSTNHKQQSAMIASDAKAATLQGTLKSLFGYKRLREGQEWAIKRCLEKKNSLLVSPTGYGKSMCYILPAALMEGVCIVVSPLISLIQDQLRELPPRIPAATLSGSLTSAATAAIIDDVIRKRIKVLFVSPERLASASFQRLFQPKWNKDTSSLERPFPPVSLLCIDEAHCLSQWAHNFRPSYLRLKSLLHKVDPQSVLAITATAGRQVVQDICNTLGIDQCTNSLVTASGGCCRSRNCHCGVWTMKTDRENIDVKTFMVASQESRLSMLVDILKKPKSPSRENKPKSNGYVEGCLSKGSIIVYVWRQRDAEVVAESIQASGVAGGVVHYHGGMDSGARSNAYSKFMRGKARICVATVAFGLGVNKPDIAGVIHMYLPASPEHFLQEIGRAGRDGRPAKALALVLEEEALVRHSQTHSDCLACSQIRSVISSFQQKVKHIIDSVAGGNWTDVPAIGVAIPLHEFSVACDCKVETIETIFSLLELREKCPTPSIQVEGIANDQVTISLKRRKLDKLAEKESVARVIQSCSVCVDAPAGERKTPAEQQLNRQQQFVAYSFGSYRFSVTEAANMLGPAAQPRHIFAALRRLQSTGEIELNFDKTASGTALRIILNNSGLNMFLGGNDLSDRLESISKSLAEEMNSIAEVSAGKVLDMNFVMKQVARVVDNDRPNVEDKDEDEGEEEEEEEEELCHGKSRSLALFQQLCHQYFNCSANSTLSEGSSDMPSFEEKIPEKEILIDALALISDLSQSRQVPLGEFVLDLRNAENLDYTALAVTKFFHGMPSVRAPISISRHNRLWGKYQAYRFAVLQATVQKVLSQ